ncbi:MAG: DUF308 domain-containing protein [Eubacterium sp.]|nr:DUF308 domain-containing protein [Eubacterium sp.]
MKNIVKTITNYVICLSVLAIIVGIVLIASPQMSLTVISISSGIYLIVQGIALIILGIKSLRTNLPFDGMLKGILSLIFGVMLVENPAVFAGFVGNLFGIWIMFSSFDEIKFASRLRNTGAPWILMIILNVFNIIIGGVILYSPILSAISLTMGLGCILIAYSVIDIIYMIAVKMNSDYIEKILEEKIEAIEGKTETVEVTVEDAVENKADSNAD